MRGAGKHFPVPPASLWGAGTCVCTQGGMRVLQPARLASQQVAVGEGGRLNARRLAPPPTSPPPQAMEKLGLNMAISRIATTMEECLKAAEEIGTMPLIIRPAFTLGGTGGGIAYNMDEFRWVP